MTDEPFDIATPLLPLVVPIDSVQPHPRNVRHGDVGAMCVQLRTHGQYRPAVVQKSTGNICAGSHMWRAAKLMGSTRLAVLVKDMDDDQAEKLMLGDNRQADLGTYDQDALEVLLREHHARGTLEGTGYDGNDLDDLAAQNRAIGEAANWDNPTQVEKDDTPPLPATERREAANVMQVSVGPELWEDFSAAVRKLRKAHQVETASQAVVAVVIDAASKLGGDR
jgi:ParB-like chromosome segregation protein Spo0J